jgi:hypothetical protein
MIESWARVPVTGGRPMIMKGTYRRRHRDWWRSYGAPEWDRRRMPSSKLKMDGTVLR